MNRRNCELFATVVQAAHASRDLLALRDEVRAVISDMREREMALWREEPHVGPCAAALMLDGFASRLEIAVGDAPRPAVYRTPQAAPDAVLVNLPISPPPDTAALQGLPDDSTGAAPVVGAGLSSKEGRGHA